VLRTTPPPTFTGEPKPPAEPLLSTVTAPPTISTGSTDQDVSSPVARCV
jgi:hypothetical protein